MYDTPLAVTLRDGVLAGVYFGAPLLAAATALGLALAILQAATQIQDSTLPQVVKMVVVAALLLLFTGALSTPLLAFARRVFETGR